MGPFLSAKSWDLVELQPQLQLQLLLERLCYYHQTNSLFGSILWLTSQSFWDMENLEHCTHKNSWFTLWGYGAYYVCNMLASTLLFGSTLWLTSQSFWDMENLEHCTHTKDFFTLSGYGAYYACNMLASTVVVCFWTRSCCWKQLNWRIVRMMKWLLRVGNISRRGNCIDNCFRKILLIIKATGKNLYSNCPRLKKWNCMKELPNVTRVFMCEFSIVFNMHSPLFIVLHVCSLFACSNLNYL